MMKDVPKEARVALLPAVSVTSFLKALQKAHFDIFDSSLQLRNNWLPWSLFWAKMSKKYWNLGSLYEWFLSYVTIYCGIVEENLMTRHLSWKGQHLINLLRESSLFLAFSLMKMWLIPISVVMNQWSHRSSRYIVHIYGYNV